MTKVFIVGSAGTTGLKIRERLSERKDIELISIPEEKRKDPKYIQEGLSQADIAFLCLPDDAAREIAALAANVDLDVRIIDTSTAHRTNPGWVYGFPEINNLSDFIQKARYVANPGCHASGFLALTAPLIESGIIGTDTLLSCTSLTGYSGGGKKMIAEYEAPDEMTNQTRDKLLDAPRLYGLTQEHKHLKEMRLLAHLNHAPAFFPVVSDYFAGMETIIPLFKRELVKAGIEDIKECYKNYYTGQVVRFIDSIDDGGFISAGKLAGYDDMILSVVGNDERITLLALFDNLGKGASGAAIQNMNIMMGADETLGLKLLQA